MVRKLLCWFFAGDPDGSDENKTTQRLDPPQVFGRLGIQFVTDADSEFIRGFGCGRA